MTNRKFSIGRFKAIVRRDVVGTQTRSGRMFDALFIIAVICGVVAIALDSVPWIHEKYSEQINNFEIVIGTCFVLEYLARTWVAPNKFRWIFSFFGLIDLIAILPFLFQGFGFAYLRSFRILRIFTIFKVARYTRASNTLLRGIVDSRTKISVFLLAVIVLETVIAFMMYEIEPDTFRTVPDALWWVIVTVTTVGYGDVVPVTVLGKVVAAFAMITSFGIIAVPTGIVASEIYEDDIKERSNKICGRCTLNEHRLEANYCDRCGERLLKVHGEDVAPQEHTLDDTL